jgi:maltose O-acetyltransferase
MKFINKIILRIFKKGYELYWKSIYNSYREKYTLHPSFKFNGTNILMYGDGEIQCGESSYVGHYSTIQSSKKYKVNIGHHTSISHNVRIYTSSAIPDQDFMQDTLLSKQGDVTIGNGVWIGANTFINPGIIIEDNSIIGANSVVTKNVEKNSIVGGVPAKLIRYKKI